MASMVLGHLRHGRAAFGCQAGRVVRQPACLLRMIDVLAHGGAELFHRSGRFFQRTGLLLRAARQIQVAAGDFTGRRGDLPGAAAHIADYLRQVVADAVHGQQQAADFVQAAGIEVHGQVAGGDLRGGRLGGGQRARHQMGDQKSSSRRPMA